MKILRRNEGLLAASAFVAFAWFHQGGGWNQNSRFALVRAIVEKGSFSIDSHIVYLVAPGGGSFHRPAVDSGQLEVDGKTYALGWPGEQGRLTPIAGAASAGATIIDVTRAAASGDLAYYGGHFHPNKAPGTSLAAVPAYFIIHALERALGFDPDAWGTLTLNAWLTSVLSIALISALGLVLFHRVAMRLSDGDARASMLATLTLAFATMFFPYATMLFEHNIIAMALLASWYAAHLARGGGRDPRRFLVLAGLCAGYAAITNYIMAVPVLMIGAYLVRARIPRSMVWYGAGLLGPFALIGFYNIVCFGTPFTTNYRYENPMFLERSGALLGVFGMPDPRVLAAILFSPFRGLFITSPVLLLGVAGLVMLYRTERFRADAVLCIAILAFFLLFNTSFNGWHGGWAVVPRYLGPVMPLLVLPVVFAYRRMPRLTAALAGISAAIMFVITAVDPQSPVGNAGFASVPGRAQWTHSPVTEYELPLMIGGQATGLLRRVPGGEERSALRFMTGPVSVNPTGMYEGQFFQRFGPGSPQASWNSFNVGELLAPRSLWSLVPLIVIVGGMVGILLRRTRIGSTSPRAAEHAEDR